MRCKAMLQDPQDALSHKAMGVAVKSEMGPI
jgi:hypothetical protein